MKNNKKLFISVLLACSMLGVTACGGGSSSVDSGNSDNSQTIESSDVTTSSQEAESSQQVSPVERIKVTVPTASIIVGDVIDLDNYVTVDGGYGPKVFDVKVNNVSREIVSVDGHMVTVLKEGTISLEISVTVGTSIKKAKISWEAMSKIKALWKTAISTLSLDFGFDCYGYDMDNNEINYPIIHNTNYTCFNQWWTEITMEEYNKVAPFINKQTNQCSIDGCYYDLDDEGTPYKMYNFGGYMKAASGNGYEWVADDMDGTNFQVLPGKVANYEYYFANWEWTLDWSKAKTMTDIDPETGEEYEYLEYDTSYIGQLPDYFSNGIEEFFYCTSQIYYGTVYPWRYMDVYYDEEAEQFYIVGLVSANGNLEYATDIMYLMTDKEDLSISFIDDYRAAGTEPTAIKCDEVAAFADSMAEAKKYQIDISAGWYNQKGEESSIYPDWEGTTIEGLLNKYTAVEYVNESTVYVEMTNPDDSVLKAGYIDNEGLYYFSNLDPTTEEIGDILYADGTDLEEFTGVWDSNIPINALALSTESGIYEDFGAAKRTVTDESIILTVNGADSQAFNAAMLFSNLATSGFGTFLEQAYEGGPHFDFVDSVITITETTMNVEFSFNVTSDNIYVIDITFSNVGVDNVPDGLFESIQFPVLD